MLNNKISKTAIKTDYSSEEDDTKKVSVKRKNNVKPKSSATITPKHTSAHSVKPNSKTKSTAASFVKGEQKGKEFQKSKSTKSGKIGANKKKSIFSPENSSESETSKVANVNKPTCKPKPELRAKVAPKVEKSKNEKRVTDRSQKIKETTGESDQNFII